MSLIVLGLSSISFAQTGTIVGTVKFAGENPNFPAVSVDIDQETCGTDPKPSKKLILSEDHGIKDAFVCVMGVNGEKLAGLEENPVFPVANCEFTNHLMVVPRDTVVDFTNEDNVLHEIHSFSNKNRPFRKDLPVGDIISILFTKAEKIRIICEVHKWSEAFLVVHNDPYFSLTDEDGNYKIENVPVGTYELQVWQESIGKKSVDVSVVAGKEVSVDFELHLESEEPLPSPNVTPTPSPVLTSSPIVTSTPTLQPTPSPVSTALPTPTPVATSEPRKTLGSIEVNPEELSPSRRGTNIVVTTFDTNGNRMSGVTVLLKSNGIGAVVIDEEAITDENGSGTVSGRFRAFSIPGTSLEVVAEDSDGAMLTAKVIKIQKR